MNDLCLVCHHPIDSEHTHTMLFIEGKLHALHSAPCAQQYREQQRLIAEHPTQHTTLLKECPLCIQIASQATLTR